MVARNKYVVTHSLAATQGGLVKEKTREVYADDVKMTSTGDAIFYQVRKSALVDDAGVRSMKDDMALVLVLKGGMFESIHLLPHKGSSEAYKETGEVDLITH